MTTVSSHIFLDGGDPAETEKADELLKAAGYSGIMGQTTNPSLITKNPEVMKYVVGGKRLTQEEGLREYRKIVEAIAKITTGPVSIQVIADQSSSKDEMLRQAREYADWIPNGVVKFPCVPEGLAAAEVFCQEGPVNITLNFSQSQAAAVHVATKNAKYPVFISPFVGRLDDKGENGMDVVVNELKMYKSTDDTIEKGQIDLTSPLPGATGTDLTQKGKSHVQVLTASIRKLDHFFYALFLKSPAVTVPYKLLVQWSDMQFTRPLHSYRYDAGTLISIPYQEMTLDKDWREYDLSHPLTAAGLTKFMEDWRSVVR